MLLSELHAAITAELLKDGDCFVEIETWYSTAEKKTSIALFLRGTTPESKTILHSIRREP